MFSISEFAYVSRSGIELISTDWFGMSRPEAFNSASAARLDAGFQHNLGFDIPQRRESRQIVESAIRLKHHAGQPFPADLGAGYVDGDDMSPESVGSIEIHRHMASSARLLSNTTHDENRSFVNVSDL